MDRDLEPETRPRGDVLPSDVQKVIVGEEGQQEWSPSLDQEDPPEPPHIKEEQEELWTSQEGEQLQGLEEADITKFLFTPVPVKSEDDEEKAQSSQLHQRQTEQMETGADGEDCGGPEPARNSHPDPHLQPETEVKTEEDSSETEDSDDWSKGTTEKINEVPESDKRSNLLEKTFSCSECGKRFSLNGNLKRHMMIHTGEKPFSCTVCGKTFKQKRHMSAHMAVHPGEKQVSCSTQPGSNDLKHKISKSKKRHNAREEGFNCSECGKQCRWNRDLKRHLSSHTGGKPFSCSVCSQRYKSQYYLKSHMKTHTGEKPFSCSECARVFIFAASLKTHMKVHTGEKPFSCSICGDSFAYKASLGRHMVIHTVGKPHSCSECGKKFSLNSYLKKHMKSHTEEKRFSCSVCGKRHHSQYNLKCHMKIHTDKKPYSCSECGRMFTMAATLKTHMKVHTREKPFSCSVCGESFTTNISLERHMASHTGEKPHSCSECGKTFSVNWDLKRHMKIHNGEKRFSCSICDKTFLWNATLTAHMTSHTGKKPYSCSVCSKRFSGLSALKKHIKTHTGEKTFSCSQCGETFAANEELKRHKVIHLKDNLKSHTGEIRFSCSICELRFTRRYQLKRHKRVCPQSSQLHQTEQNRETEPGASSSTEQMETGADGKDYQGPEPSGDSDFCKESKHPSVSERDKKINTGGKRYRRYSCSVCGKIFSISGNLKTHMKIHTGEKPFSCSICRKTYAYKASLGRHMSIHTGDKLHSCTVCEQRFTWDSQLRRHKRDYHQSSQLHQNQTENKREAEPGASSSTEQLHTKEEVPPEQQEWSPSLDQEDPPEPPHIKEEQEELWTSQEGEQLQGLEEADITKFLFTPVPVKSEDDEEKPQSSQLHQRQTEQMETGADGEECGGPEPDTHLQHELKPFSCSKCGKTFCRRLILKRHMRTHTGEKLISCSVCGKSSTQTGSLTRHTSVNTGDRRFNCSICNKRFTQSTDVKHHKCIGPQSSQLHQQDKTEDSSDTEDSDEWSKEIREPPSGSKSLNNNEVSESGVRCNTEENPHMAVHTGEKRFSCSVCYKAFTWKRNLTQHMAIHTGEKRFSCSVCCKRFTQNINLRLHMTVHTGEKPFQCSVCGKRFSLKGSLTAHMAIHTGEKRFCCIVCDQEFTWRYQLAKHKRVCPQSSQLPQTEQNRETEPGASSSTEQMEPAADGEDCGGPEPARNSHPDPHLQPETEDSEEHSMETREPQLGLNNEVHKNDMKCNNEEKIFSCSDCGKTFSLNSHLKIHMRLHTDEKPFSCSLCPKTFTYEASLGRHMALHTGEKSHSCSFCEQRFTWDTQLRRHKRVCPQSSQLHQTEQNREAEPGASSSTEQMETGADGEDCGGPEPARDSRHHTDGNPFSCSVCGKIFTRKSNLTKHITIHKGEQPFSCSVCGKRFTRKRNVTLHMAIHTGEKIFSCSACDQRFTWDCQLRKHKRVCPQSSQLHQTEQNREAEPGASSSTEQMEPAADGEDCGGPKPARNSHPDPHLQPEIEVKTEDSAEDLTIESRSG